MEFNVQSLGLYSIKHFYNRQSLQPPLIANIRKVLVAWWLCCKTDWYWDVHHLHHLHNITQAECLQNIFIFFVHSTIHLPTFNIPSVRVLFSEWETEFWEWLKRSWGFNFHSYRSLFSFLAYVWLLDTGSNYCILVPFLVWSKKHCLWSTELSFLELWLTYKNDANWLAVFLSMGLTLCSEIFRDLNWLCYTSIILGDTGSYVDGWLIYKGVCDYYSWPEIGQLPRTQHSHWLNLVSERPSWYALTVTLHQIQQFNL